MPSAKKEKFIEPAKKGNSVFLELGATRILECWGDDVHRLPPCGTGNNDETIVFSWIEWPDKATRNAAMSKMGGMMKSDDRDRMNPEKNPMPFYGKRMIFGGFMPVVELGG